MNRWRRNFGKIFLNFVFLVGIKLDLLDHHARIVFNNVKPLFLKRYKVAMLNKRSKTKSILNNSEEDQYSLWFFLSTSLLSIVYSCLRFIVIIWQLIKKKNKTKNMKCSHDRIDCSIYIFDWHTWYSDRYQKWAKQTWSVE